MGTIDKKLIYRKRKKFNDVKKYIKTVNPDLPGQKIQKGYFKEAILAWKTEGYTNEDIKAWDLYARTIKKYVSGFNVFTGFRINALKENKTWTPLINYQVLDVDWNKFAVAIDCDQDKTGILYVGDSKTNMFREISALWEPASPEWNARYQFPVKDLIQNTRYYFYIRSTEAGEAARTGIYSIKTLSEIPEPPPIDIDIGMPAIDRPGAFGIFTIINSGNPANAAGKITSVEIWALATLYNCKVATFYGSGTNYSTRDWEVIGTVNKGEKRTFVVDLDVEIGDFIGIYYTAGNIERTTSGEPGCWSKSGDNIPCKNLSGWSIISGDAISIYGKGSTS